VDTEIQNAFNVWSSATDLTFNRKTEHENVGSRSQCNNTCLLRDLKIQTYDFWTKPDISLFYLHCYILKKNFIYENSLNGTEINGMQNCIYILFWKIKLVTNCRFREISNFFNLHHLEYRNIQVLIITISKLHRIIKQKEGECFYNKKI